MARRRSVPTIIARKGALRVERDPRRPSGRLLRQDDMDASYVDLADVSHLEFDYMRWMRLVLRAARARRIVHVGGGACALPRAMAASDPGGLQEVCEVDPDVLALARAYMGLRRAPGLRVRCTDGRAYVAAQPDASWDAVVVDAFLGAAVPPRLVTVEALRDIARVAPLALVNVIDNRVGAAARVVGAALASAYPRIWSLVGRSGNTVVVGAKARYDLDRIAAEAAADPSPPRLLAGPSMDQLIAGASAGRDEDLGSRPTGASVHERVTQVGGDPLRATRRDQARATGSRLGPTIGARRIPTGC